MSTWYPRPDKDLLAFAANWAARAVASAASYNWTASDATTLGDLVDSFSTALTAATDPGTRTKVTITAKDGAKAGLLAEMKALKLKLEGAQPPVSPEHREDLGLPGTAAKPTTIPPPSTQPVATVTGAGNRTVSVRLADELTPNKKAKPQGVDGAEIFYFLGATPPADINAWSFEGLATKSDFTIDFGAAAVVGTTVWIAARWYNPRGETGPVSAPAQSSIVGGVTAQAA